jgi:S1 RNA binding domain protein
LGENAQAESGETLAEEEIVVGSVVEGVVTGITRFGAFVLLPGGKTGLVHISEVADSYVNDIKDFVKEQDQVKVKILSYDGSQKIALSIRQAKPGASAVRPRSGGSSAGPGRGRGPARPQNFEDRLARFMKESEDKQADLRRHHDSRRGGHRGRGEGSI